MELESSIEIIRDAVPARRIVIQALPWQEAVTPATMEQAMAVGWAHDGAVQEQIDASIADAVERARDRLTAGESLAFCEDCGEPIPEARRKALPGVRRCVTCQAEVDAQQTFDPGYNRRGSKDSQLK